MVINTGQTLAITGATGFVGGATLSAALSVGYRARALTRREQPARGGVTWIAGDLADRAALETLCDGADAVLHIAGATNAPTRAGFEAGNVDAVLHMIAAAKAQGVKRFVHVSSLAARRPQLSVYGETKLAGERLVATSMLDWTAVRPPAVYGPGDRDMLELFRMAKRGIVLLPPKGRISAIHVDDLAALLVALLPRSERTTAEVYEADDGRDGGWSHRGFARAVGAAVGRSIEIFSIPAPLMLLGGHVDRLIRRGAARLTPDRARYLAHPDWTIDPARRPPPDIWNPRIRTPDGLATTARWYREQGWL
ncbi:SDR family oxidoreductase [Novosphingopyxis sp.]|uniref:SDR family oxidoreductase n=1 Tax=Novosphingopyxis sp. TaxID=2709690 RepID=UPI003B59F1B9